MKNLATPWCGEFKFAVLAFGVSFMSLTCVASESVASESVASESVASESVASESVASESVASESVASESVASESVASESVEKLKVRVAGRWSALIGRDFSKAYSYFSPAYRKLYSKSDYISRFGSVVSWRSITIDEVSVVSGNSKVRLTLLYQLAIPRGEGARLNGELGLLSKQLEENWLWDGSQWWFVELEQEGAAI